MIFIAGYYVKNKDYSEAIAHETDIGRREHLLAERQNKIDGEGMRGTVASNAAVTNWRGSYRPTRRPSQESEGAGFSAAALYREAENRRLSAFAQAREENARQLRAQKDSIEGQYVSGATQAQVNSRLTAGGSEEKLAALGLSAGGRYAAPTSGVTETTRAAADNALRQDLNGLSAAKLAAMAQAERAAAEADSALQRQDAAAASDAALKLANLQLQQQNADRTYALQSASVSGYLGEEPTLGNRQYQAGLVQKSRSQISENEQKAFTNAMTRWKTYGYVLPADAALLGVRAGTKTADAKYREATLRLNQLKTAYQTSK